MAERAPRYYRFDGFHVDTLARVLRHGDGAPVALTAKAFDVLRYLLAHRDRLVGKDELLDAIWAGRVVEENSLTRAVSALRHALGVGAGDHRYVVTVPGHGYRFVAEVRADDAVARGDEVTADAQQAEAGAAPAAAVPTIAAPIRRWPMLGAALALALVAVVAWSTREPATPIAAPGTTTLAVLPFRSLSAGSRDPLLELGLAETVIARLSQARSLRVRSLSSAERVVARTPDPLAAAQRLGASSVVEGATQSMRRRGP